MQGYSENEKPCPYLTLKRAISSVSIAWRLAKENDSCYRYQNNRILIILNLQSVSKRKGREEGDR
jgi:hypothetical protein